jgi:poly(A) polymerase
VEPAADKEVKATNYLPMDLHIQERLHRYPRQLMQAIAETAMARGGALYVAGGTVRDWLLGRESADLDITVATDGFGWARQLTGRLGATFVGLDQEEGVARVVWQGITVDFAGFREGTSSIEMDLARRDFTINGLAICIGPQAGDGFRMVPGGKIIDPTGGIADLKGKIIRCTSPAVFARDPLRLLRAFRFQAGLQFSIERRTKEAICATAGLIGRVAAERISRELELIMAAELAGKTIRAMSECNLLGKLFPELTKGVGMLQPTSHHLDVFEHSLTTLDSMEKIIQVPGRDFPGHDEDMGRYLSEDKRGVRLKWAALFHDLGKPCTYRKQGDKEGRITFHNHDMAGAECFSKEAQRLKWSRDDTQQIARFIAMHMWPFHLHNVRRANGLTPRAALRLVKAAGKDLPGLFMLAMADSLAGRGADRPQALEEGIVALYEDVCRIYRHRIEPVLENPRLLTGTDLKELFMLEPGPIFRTILDGLQQAQVAGEVGNRDEALVWVRSFLQDKKI